MDAFGNYPQKQSDASYSQGNPFSGSNVQNPSMASYMSFLQSVLQQYASTQSNQGQKQQQPQAPKGPVKWGGANSIEVSKGQPPQAETIINQNTTPTDPQQPAPSTPQPAPSTPQPWVPKYDWSGRPLNLPTEDFYNSRMTKF